MIKRMIAMLLCAGLLLCGMSMPAAAEAADADVIVIGAGGGGMSAALEAAAQGAQKVIVVEMTAKTGGALNYTSGSLSAAGTIIQKEEGVEDSVEAYVADILRIGSDFGGKPSEELVNVYANEAAAVFDWLYENGLKDNTYSVDRATGGRAVFAPEHALFSIKRTYKPAADDKANYKSAAHEVLDQLLAAEERIEVVTNTKATHLEANEKGQVLTVVAEGPQGEVRYTASRAIIVATGGYSANGKLMAQYVPYGEYYLAGGAAGSDGNGLRLMQEVGAALNMDSMSAIPTFPMGLVSKDNPKTGAIANTYAYKAGGIVINQNGERFCDETETNPAVREVALEEQPQAIQYDIFTDKIIEDLTAAGQSYFYDAYFKAEGQPGWHVVTTASTIEELAGKIGVPADTFAKTVADYNAAVEAGGTDEFGRLYDGTKTAYNVAVNKIEGDKFYAVPLKALCVMTLGGITANSNMQVLDEAGNVIPGLYAAGEVVGGVWGKFVSSGTGVMGPIVFGKVAARHAMTNEPAEGYEVKAASNMLDESLFVKEKAAGAEFDMSAELKDGEYTATVDGQEGQMTVKTVIAGGVIASVEVVENHETQAVAAAALESIPAKIVETNSVDVDAVAGATLTSGRIMKAVAQCLTEAAVTAEGEEIFSAEYEMKGTTSAGKPKNDTFIFEGKTTDGKITELNFDIIRNKGQEGEYSKKGIMGYSMNVSDAAVEKTEDGYKLTTLTSYGYSTEFDEGMYAQFMVTASAEKLTEETTFGELNFVNLAKPGEPVAIEKAIIAYTYLANEAGITLTAETPVKDLVAIHGFYKDGAFVEGSTRVSFAGYHGGRSYGEQIDAIVAHILENGMTLEEVYEMFKTVNQSSQPIEERDAISGATIAFVGDFQRMVYLAIHGELFEGVVTHTTTDGSTKVEVATQGYAGEIETHVTFDAEGKIVSVTVRDAQETDGIGGNLTAEGSEFLSALVAGQENVGEVEAVSGATMTSSALKKAVQMAQEYMKGL